MRPELLACPADEALDLTQLQIEIQHGIKFPWCVRPVLCVVFFVFGTNAEWIRCNDFPYSLKDLLSFRQDHFPQSPFLLRRQACIAFCIFMPREDFLCVARHSFTRSIPFFHLRVYRWTIIEQMLSFAILSNMTPPFTEQLSAIGQQYEQETTATEDRLHKLWIETCRQNLDALVQELRLRGRAILTANPPVHDPEGEMSGVWIETIEEHLGTKKMDDGDHYHRFPRRVRDDVFGRDDWEELYQEVMGRIFPDRDKEEDEENEDDAPVIVSAP